MERETLSKLWNVAREVPGAAFETSLLLAPVIAIPLAVGAGISWKFFGGDAETARKLMLMGGCLLSYDLGAGLSYLLLKGSEVQIDADGGLIPNADRALSVAEQAKIDYSYIDRLKTAWRNYRNSGEDLAVQGC